MENITVSQTIFAQIGGNKFTAMTGAHTFTPSPTSLTFHFKMCKDANICRIVLNSRDLYDIEFYKHSPIKGVSKRVMAFTDLYHDMLSSTFKDFTGLHTVL